MALVDAGTSSCVCGATEFCCIDHCQPLGSSCGSGPDGGTDAPVDPCTLTRARPDGSGEATQAALCAGETQLVSCEPDVRRDCPGTSTCQSWFDAPRGVWSASCFSPGESSCTELDPVTRCEGSDVVALCNENINYPAFGPPYRQVRVSCSELYGADAVCVTDGGSSRCDIPSAPTCDEETFVTECTADAGGALVCGSLGRVVAQACDPGHRCLDNASTRETWGVACIPRDAVVSTHGPTSGTNLRCEDTMHLRREAFGYEWTERCEPTLVFRSDGAGGFVEVVVDQVCFEGAGGARCEVEGIEHCDPATFPTVCGADGMSSRSCEVDEVRVRPCDVFGITYPCDSATGECGPVEPCSGMFPFTSRCVLGGEYRMVCHPTEGVAVPEPCAGCVEEGSSTRCDP